MLVDLVKKVVRRMGYDIVPYSKLFTPDMDAEAVEIMKTVRPFTLTSITRLFGLIQAVRYVAQARIPGDIVECGVWRGGSMMSVAHALLRANRGDVKLHLFDTYEGMSAPTDEDVSFDGREARDELEATRRRQNTSVWCYATVEDVQANLFSTGYDRAKLNFVKGKVEDTVPASAPEQISLLRLDTDWYESTRHEMIHLFPRLSPGGVLILDDYGHWQGSRKAVDEYLAANNISMLLNRLDYTGRVAIKR